MAKGKKQSYENATQSIFDFIFTQSKKGKPARPIKPSDVSGSDEFVRSLAEIASKPNFYITDTLEQLLNDTVLADAIVQFQLDKFDGKKLPNYDGDAGRMRVRGRELVKFLKNPSSYIDSVAKNAQAERKLATAAAVGGMMDQAIAATYAMKSGMNMKDAMRLGSAARRTVTADMREDTLLMRAENSALEFFNTDSVKANRVAQAMRKITATHGRFKVDLWTKMTPTIRQELKSRASLTDQEVDAFADHYDDKIDYTMGSHIDESGDLTDWGYRETYQSNLALKLKTPGYITDQKERELIQKALALALTYNRLKGVDVDSMPDFSRSLKIVDTKIAQLTNTPNLSAFDQDYLKSLQKNRIQITTALKKQDEHTKKISKTDVYQDLPTKHIINALKSELDTDRIRWLSIQQKILDRRQSTGNMTYGQSRLDLAQQKIEELEMRMNSLKMIPGASLRIKLGQYNQTYNYMKSMVYEGGLGRAILNGSFFFVGIGAPGVIRPRNYKMRVFDAATNTYKWESVNGGLLVTERSDVSPVYGHLTDLYYFTPQALLKTVLWDGNFFKYAAYKREKSMERLIARNTVLFQSQFPAFFPGGKFDGDKMFEFIDALSNSNLSIASEAARLLKSYESITKIGHRFSTPMRLWKNYLESSKRVKWLKEEINKRIGDTLLKLFQNNVLWQKTVQRFILGETGLKQVLAVGVKAFLTSLGIVATGGIGGFLVGALSDFIVKVVFDLTAKLLKLVSIAVSLGVTFVVIVIFVIMVIIFDMNFLTGGYRHVTPGPCLECSPFNPNASLYPDFIDNIPSIGNAPADATCPILSSPLTCTQGPAGQCSHTAMGTQAIDVAGSDPVWYAPSDGRVLSYTAVNRICNDGKDVGGILYFADSAGNVYRMFHVQAVAFPGPVKKGNPVALMRYDIERGNCWTGPHFHLEVKVNGVFIDSERWYRDELKCNLTTCPTSCP